LINKIIYALYLLRCDFHTKSSGNLQSGKLLTMDIIYFAKVQ